MASSPASPKIPPTPDQIEKVALWLKKGAIPETAAARAGINKATLQSWLRAGYAGKPGFKEFAEAFDEALLEFECKLLSFIEGNAAKNVNSAQWLFQIRFGPRYKRYAEAEAAQVSGEENVPAKILELTEEAIEAAEKRAEAAAEKGIH